MKYLIVVTSELPKFTCHDNQHISMVLPFVSSVDSNMLIKRIPEELRELQQIQ